jgi:hypothetical protein
MNIKLKTTIVIIFTLAIGIIIGAMLNRTLTQNRIKNILSRRDPGRFAALYEKIIEPTPEQSKLIREVLGKHGKRISEIRKKFHEEMKSEFELMKKKMDSILTPEQKKRLEKRLARRFPRHKMFPGKRGPWLEKRKRDLPKEQEFKRFP